MLPESGDGPRRAAGLLQWDFGDPTRGPGFSPGGSMPVYENLSYSAYEELPGIRSGDLRAIRQSPRHYRLREARKEADEMRVGRTLHDIVAGADLDSCCTVWRGKVRRGKQWEAFVAKESAPIITEEQEATIVAMSRALKEHDVARELLSRPARKELVVTWESEEGVQCKARLDSLTDDGTILELKTDGKGIDERRFAQRMVELGYHLQFAWYQRGLLVADELWAPVTVVAVEQHWPHDVAVYDIGEDTIMAGLEECMEAVYMLKHCQETGRWPGAHPGRTTLELPPWYWRQAEQDAGSGLNLQGVRRGK
jgi:hypothetical protein